MPHDPKIIGQTIVPKDAFGAHDQVIVYKHEAPSDDEGNVEHDPNKYQDFAIAGVMMQWLQRYYPGHGWGTICDTRQGIVKFNIPVLMGFENYWLVNLHTHHDIVREMHRGAGEILERYCLPRGRFQLTPFLEAREQHSILVNRSRKVPG